MPPDAIRLESFDVPPADALRAVQDGLDAFNDAAAPLASVRPLATLALDSEGRTVGGAIGRSWGACCELQMLWVAPGAQRRGIGSALLREFESQAAGRGCRIHYLTTLSYQAPAFYARHGYAKLAEIAGYPDDIRKYLMQRVDTRPVEAEPAPAAAGSAAVTLREITADSVRAVTKLAVHPAQQGFVAPNAISLAQALFAEDAWYRAIHAGEELVGFVMVADETLRKAPPPAPTVGLWRFMIDARHQRRGIGRDAIALVIGYARSRGVDKLYTSYVPEPGGPGPFYLSLGFVPTGEVDDGEVVLAYPLR